MLVIHPSISQNNDTQALAYNVLLGGVGGGLGAVINKKPENKLGKTFVRGFWKGSIGGAVVYSSKKLNTQIAKQQNFRMAWPSKILNAAGTSIIENAAYNRDFWERWHLNIGFNYLEIDTKNKFQFKYKLRPLSLGIAFGTAINSKFDLKRSLQIGSMVFSADQKYMPNAAAIVIGNVIRVRSNRLSDYDLFSHEIIHIYQKNDLNIINSFMNPLTEKWSQNSFYGKLDKYFDIEYEYAANAIWYGLEEINRGPWSDNFLEKEAEYYSFPNKYSN